MVAELPKLILSNGIQFPNIGYGTGMASFYTIFYILTLFKT
jgi:hypothetical protein